MLHMRVYNFGASRRNLTKFYHRMWLTNSTKFGRVKNVQNLARFLTTVDFYHKYLRNGSTHRKLEKYLINYILSPIGRK